MTEQLHSVNNYIKWRHELKCDYKLQKCNFLQLKTLVDFVNRDGINFTSINYKQKYIYIQRVLLDDSLIQRLSRYTKVWNFFFWEGHHKLWFIGQQSLKLTVVS